MNDFPAEAKKLLSTAPDEFVEERKKLVRDLRLAGRSEEAAGVAGVRKPPAVVLAVNRAVRARPKAARAAADAASKVKKTQLGGDLEAYREALQELEDALALLSEVAYAHAVPPGKEPSEMIRRRVRDLLRNAVADDEAREALARGVLSQEIEAAGFDSFSGIVPARAGPVTAAARKTTRRDEERRLAREQELRAELAHAEERLKEAKESVRATTREEEKAKRAVAALRAQIERL